MKKAKTIGVIILIIGGLIFGGKQLLQWGWEKGASRKEIQVTPYKIILLKNKFDTISFYIKINFEYEPENLFPHIEPKIDSIILNCYPNEKISLLLPILVGDSAEFPKSFYIKIYNEDKSKLLKELNQDLFMRYTIPGYMLNKNNPLTAEEWTLVIDSTLLDLR